jgi:hypothetical protein
MTTEKETQEAEQARQDAIMAEKAKRQAARDAYAASCRADRNSRQDTA